MWLLCLLVALGRLYEQDNISGPWGLFRSEGARDLVGNLEQRGVCFRRGAFEAGFCWGNPGHKCVCFLMGGFGVGFAGGTRGINVYVF